MHRDCVNSAVWSISFLLKMHLLLFHFWVYSLIICGLSHTLVQLLVYYYSALNLSQKLRLTVLYFVSGFLGWRLWIGTRGGKAKQLLIVRKFAQVAIFHWFCSFANMTIQQFDLGSSEFFTVGMGGPVEQWHWGRGISTSLIHHGFNALWYYYICTYFPLNYV